MNLVIGDVRQRQKCIRDRHAPDHLVQCKSWQLRWEDIERVPGHLPV